MCNSSKPLFKVDTLNNNVCGFVFLITLANINKFKGF